MIKELEINFVFNENKIGSGKVYIINNKINTCDLEQSFYDMIRKYTKTFKEKSKEIEQIEDIII